MIGYDSRSQASSRLARRSGVSVWLLSLVVSLYMRGSQHPSAFSFHLFSLLVWISKMAAVEVTSLPITTDTTGVLPSGIPLTTRWSYPEDCRLDWAYPTPAAVAESQAPTVLAPDLLSPDFLFRTVDGRVVPYPTHGGHTSCRPLYVVTSLYSPGCCPEGQVIMMMSEIHATTTSNDETTTYFKGICCRR